MTSHFRSSVRRVGLVGTGVIGAGWAARCLARGLDVVASDASPSAEKWLRETVARAWPSLARLGLADGASVERLAFTATLEDAVSDADFVQESAPEDEALKRRLLAQIDAATSPDVVIASSTSGLLPTNLQADCRRPQRVLVGHPFNPVYLLPLVEVVAGRLTAAEAVAAALEVYRGLAMHPLRVRKEIPGFIADRLMEAMWREMLHLVADGVATTEEVDAAIAYGPGLRWAFMGSFLTYHLAGGEHGLHHFLEQFAPALALPWARFDGPELTGELAQRLLAGTESQSRGRDVREIERLRDECLLGIRQVLERSWYAHMGRLDDAG